VLYSAGVEANGILCYITLMATTQSGFSKVIVVVAILAVGLIAASSWYISQAQNKSKEEDTGTSQQQPQPQDTASDQPFGNWTQTSKDGITFQHPSDWTLAETGPGPVLKSSDYAVGTQGATLTKGASISLTKPVPVQDKITADNPSNSNFWSPSYTNLKTITVNGASTLQYNVADDIVSTLIFGAGGTFTNVQIQFAPSDRDAVFAIYGHLLETVSIE
jgi:hypothetical protein